MNFSIKIDPATREEYIAVAAKGRALLVDPILNKGTAFTKKERSQLDLHGLLPPSVTTIEDQLERVYKAFQSQKSDLERFIYLSSLHDRNETLFFRLLVEHIDEMMPIVYTPTVGLACQQFSRIYRTTRGIYVGYSQRGNIAKVLSNANIPRASVIVVTDGERILGLGDQGLGGMGIPIGKLALYTLCAGISPNTVVPIMLDVGTNNEERLADPLYLGRREHRVHGNDYQVFIDEFVEAVQEVFPNVLLQWEDFLKDNAMKQLARFRNRMCTFNDDIQGTASVVVAGLFGAMRLLDHTLADQRILFAGAGASAQGIAHLIVVALMESGLSQTDAQERVWMVDSRGLVCGSRPGLAGFKATFARSDADVTGWPTDAAGHIPLLDAIRGARPTVLFGNSGIGGLFTEEILRTMGEINERPMIFPLSNPNSRAECTPQAAADATDGRAVIAAGSPFPPIEIDGARRRVAMGNNAFIFPGIGLGVTVAHAKRVTDAMFLGAAHTLAAHVTEEDLAQNAVYPEMGRIREVSLAIACATARTAVAEGHADADVLDNLEKRVRRAMWYPEYRPIRYEP